MEEKSSQKVKNKNLKSWFLPIAIIAIIIAIALVGWFFMRGNTVKITNNVITGKFDSLTCTATNVTYPLFVYDDSDAKELLISTIFDDDRLDSISLKYRLYYNSKDEITASEGRNHAAMNLRSQAAGLGPNALNAHYSILSDGLEMNLHAYGHEVNGASKEYFMLENIDENFTKQAVQNTYTEQGLKCSEI